MRSLKWWQGFGFPTLLMNPGLNLLWGEEALLDTLILNNFKGLFFQGKLYFNDEEVKGNLFEYIP